MVAACPEENIVISPLSATTNLSMVVNACDEETRDRLLGEFGFGDINDLNTYNARVISSLPNCQPSKVTVGLANSIWYNSDFGASGKEGYSALMTELYAADQQSLSLSDAASIDRINGWISEKTNNIIPDFYKPGDLDAATVAWVNALYFKGIWDVPFDESLTSEQPFHNAQGEEIGTVPMMVTPEFIGWYYESEKGVGAELVYGDYAFRMRIFVPAEGVALADVVSEAFEWDEFVEKHVYLTVKLPRFSTEYEYRLDAALSHAGMDIGDVKLKEIVTTQHPDGLPYGSLGSKQRTRIDVDETGTVAAAVTATGMYMSDMPTSKAEVCFDRPFVYVISEYFSRTPIIAGVVVKP